MGKSNKLISFLLCVLIVLSAANIFLGVTNSKRINQLENAPPVVIEEYKTTTTEKETMTFRTTTEAATTTEEAVVTEAVSTTEKKTEAPETTPTETEAPTTVSESTQKTSSDICYVTSSGTKYHRAGCSYLKKSKTQMTISEAKSCGYSPCSRCY